MITGFLAIGNGEKCSYCDEIMTDSKIGGMDLMDHMRAEHHDEFLAQLFPEKDNSSKEGVSPDNDKMIRSNEDDEYAEDIDLQAFAQGRKSSFDDVKGDD